MADKLTSVNVSMPRSLRKFVKDRIDHGGFGNTSEYMRHLIRNDQERVRQRIEGLLIEGLDSGEPIEATPQFWDELRRRVKSRADHIRASTRKAAG